MTSVHGDGSELPGRSGTDDQTVVEDAPATPGGEHPSAEPSSAEPSSDARASDDRASDDRASGDRASGEPAADGAAGRSSNGGAGAGTTTTTTTDDVPPPSMVRHTPWWKETLILVVTALVLALIIKTFFVQAFYIPSGSMESTLNVNDRILVEKVSYWFGSPKRGDIVVFKDPDNWLGDEGGSTPSNPVTSALAFIGLYPTGGHLVKRVIGIGGDHVQCKNNTVYVNGVALHEQAYVTMAPTGCLGEWSVHVPPGHLWVLGDNRLNSADSRAHMNDPDHGFVPVSDVVGKVFVTVWPIDRWRFFSRPTIFDNPALDDSVGVIGDTIPIGALMAVAPMLYQRRSLRPRPVATYLYDRDQDL